jgi:two-component system phosphate regulon sensor histidine kinase PhoR
MSIFWFAPALRIGFVMAVAVVAFLVVGPITALAVLAAGLFGFVLIQLRYLDRLRRWLRSPDVARVPDGWGAWGDVFSELYRVYRREEQVQLRLGDALKRMELATQALPDGVVLLDRELRIEWCNSVAERLLGIDRTSDRGRILTNLVRYPGLVAWLGDEPVDAPGQPLVIETTTVPPAFLSLQVARFGEHDRLLVLRDVTAVERTESIRRDFIANVSHELRTPLTVINGYLEHMASGDIDGPLRTRAIQVMFDQSQRMTRLVEDLLTLSRLEAGDNPITDTRVDVTSMVWGLLEEGRSLSAGRHRIEAEAATIGLRGSPEELRSAFANLLSNAIRYTPSGGVIRLSWEADADGAVYSVSDTGIGIAPEHIPRLTERFYRVDRSRSRETGGTGLGLAIVKHVLLRHQASLVIESELGRGTVFRCRFPRARVLVDPDTRLGSAAAPASDEAPAST